MSFKVRYAAAVIGFAFGWVFSDEIITVARWILGK